MPTTEHSPLVLHHGKCGRWLILLLATPLVVLSVFVVVASIVAPAPASWGWEAVIRLALAEFFLITLLFSLACIVWAVASPKWLETMLLGFAIKAVLTTMIVGLLIGIAFLSFW